MAKKNPIVEAEAPVTAPEVVEEVKILKAKKAKKPAKAVVVVADAPVELPVENAAPVSAPAATQAPVAEPAPTEEPKKMVAAKKRKPAKVAVVVAAPEALASVVVEAPKPIEEPKKVVVAKKRKPAMKKMVVKEEVKVAAPVAMPEPEPEVSVAPPQTEEAPKLVAQYRATRPVMPPAVHRKTTEVESTTKTVVAVGLAAAGALALATAAFMLSMSSDNISQMLNDPYAPLPAAASEMMANERTVEAQFDIASNSSVEAVAPAEILGDGVEHAIAAFDVVTKGDAWTFEKLRIQLSGTEVLKAITVRDETGAPVMGSVVPVADSDHQYDVYFEQKIPADAMKIYTVFASFEFAGSTNVPVTLTILTDGLLAHSDSGSTTSALSAPIVGPSWTVVPPPAPAPVKKSSKKK